jgi:2-keto-4-pentenoate hydratase/2-oxohepta-3-ene-1,7-dioic acid hydratase in catechol pathway
MKLVTFRNESETHLGLIKNDQVFSLTAMSEWYRSMNPNDYHPEDFLSDMKNFIEQSDNALPYTTRLIDFSENMEKRKDNVSLKVAFLLNDIEILAPLSQPEKIICVGLNYLDHCLETGMEPPKSPVVFSKYANAIIGDQQAIELPVNSHEVDFEAELAVVIGKEVNRVSEEEANEYIFGYTILNDVSARDLQFTDGQWMRGKTADTFAPIGPYIVTKDEIEDPHKLDISLTLNGEVMQDSNTSNLIFTIPYIISFLSQSMTLKPGDIIATGTPPGVGMGRDPKVWLKKGDQLSITIEKIGTISNSVKEAATI